MKKLVTAIQKGGQGKTVTTCHLAWDFFKQKKLRVLVVDLDTQANTSFVLADYCSEHVASRLFGKPVSWPPGEGPCLVVLPADPKLADLEGQPMDKVAAKLRASLEALSGAFDVCLIDTPPSLGVLMASAVLCADYVLCPVELETFSLQGLEKMLTVVANLHQQNPALTFLGMLPNKVNGREPRHQEQIDAMRASHPGLVLPVQIGLRPCIAQAVGTQETVWASSKTAARPAKKEMSALANYVFEKMEIA